MATFISGDRRFEIIFSDWAHGQNQQWCHFTFVKTWSSCSSCWILKWNLCFTSKTLLSFHFSFFSLSLSLNFVPYFFSPLRNCLWRELDKWGGGRDDRAAGRGSEWRLVPFIFLARSPSCLIPLCCFHLFLVRLLIGTNFDIQKNRPKKTHKQKTNKWKQTKNGVSCTRLLRKCDETVRRQTASLMLCQKWLIV